MPRYRVLLDIGEFSGDDNARDYVDQVFEEPMNTWTVCEIQRQTTYWPTIPIDLSDVKD